MIKTLLIDPPWDYEINLAGRAKPEYAVIQPVGTFEAALGQYEVIEASAEERKALEAAGYILK